MHQEIIMDLKESYEDLIRLFAATNSEEEMKALFSDLFTDSEQKDFTLRWKLMNDLYQHVPQREIASNLHISLCKITRGSKMLKREDGYVRRVLSERYDDHLHL